MYFEKFDNGYYLDQGFYDITNKLSSLLPSTQEVSESKVSINFYQSPTDAFLKCIAHLERLFFLEDQNHYNTFNGVFYKYNSGYLTYKNHYFANRFKTGFILNTDASTHYEPHPRARHLEVAEKEFKVNNSQFLKIFTIDDLLIVYTNKDLPFSTIVKLKMLQWKLFKKHIKDPQPLIEEFLQALLDEDLIKLNEVTGQILNLPVLQKMRYDALNEVFQTDYSQKINDLEHEILSSEQRYLQTQNRLTELVSRICEMQEEHEYLTNKAKQEQDNTELLKYLSKHPYIKDIEKIDKITVKFYYEAPLIYYDDYLIEKIIKNQSRLHQCILRAMLDKKYEVMTRCMIQFNTQTYKITPIRIGKREFIGQPHLDTYGCTGNHNLNIHDCRKTGDYLGAIEQITVAVLNLNFADGVVTDTFLGTLIDNPAMKTWRNKETGELVSTKNIVEEYKHEKTETD